MENNIRKLLLTPEETCKVTEKSPGALAKDRYRIRKRFLTPRETYKIIGKSPGALANDRYRKRGLPYIKMGARIFYDLDSLLEYMRRHEIHHEE